MSVKCRLKDKRFVYLILLVFIIFILLAFFPLGVASNFGIRPMTHRCLGIIVSSKSFVNFLPEGDFTFFSTGVRQFRYYVPHRLLNDRPLCLGVDVWYGE
ncbi:hypothetical protein ISS86_00675 [Candidatus Microgenomates bacterium]|nr:hypothetical protein [Candidatus Microgenomates bacterium]